ncbi:MAG TPA: type II toxin-antitoxin system ParD family antitoxin [Thermomicrobiales bacterium]|jgi:antitoxin ParD1/3/4
MGVTLTPRAEELIRQKVANGPYQSVDEVIEEALEALDERDRLARLRAAIATGDAQLARGEGIPYTPQLMDEIEREAEEAYQRGEQPRPDVCP